MTSRSADLSAIFFAAAMTEKAVNGFSGQRLSGVKKQPVL
jgi:hypothetical protein